MGAVSGETLIVWDLDEQYQTDNDIVLWRCYEASESDRIYSIPQLVENNADDLRSSYLSLIHELGETRLEGKRIVDHLQIHPGFSNWWMTLINEKCNFEKSPKINDAVKLLSFREWLHDKGYSKLLLFSANTQLADSMALMAVELSIGFEHSQVKKKRLPSGFLRRIYADMPFFLQAAAWLARHLVSRWPLKGAGVDEWKNSKAKVTFVSYLFNLVRTAAHQGVYESRYWTALTDILMQHGVASNWIHIYIEDDILPTARQASKIIQAFNKSHKDTQVHVTLHSFLSVGLVFNVILDWFHLRKVGKNIISSLRAKSGFMWPLLEYDYLSSVRGADSINKLLSLSLFERAMESLPKQDYGCYLQENQGWEFGFIHAWCKAGHGDKLIGFPHATIRFWDMRYFNDPRSYLCEGENDLPLPKYVGMNGSVAKKMYQDAGYPEDRIVDVEALRYLHLLKARNGASGNSDSLVTVLILGDYLKENTELQMGLLQAAVPLIENDLLFVVKAHPNFPISKEDYPNLQYEVTNDPIPSLLDDCILAYTSSITSAAVDVYCSGKPVVTVLNPKELNLSPLKGSDGVEFVSTSEELAAVMNEVGSKAREQQQGEDYFYLDAELARWRRLLIE